MLCCQDLGVQGTLERDQGFPSPRVKICPLPTLIIPGCPRSRVTLDPGMDRMISGHRQNPSHPCLSLATEVKSSPSGSSWDSCFFFPAYTSTKVLQVHFETCSWFCLDWGPGIMQAEMGGPLLQLPYHTCRLQGGS